MATMIEGPLATALEQDRTTYNTLFATARRLDRRLDPAAFADALTQQVAPVVAAVAAHAPERVDAVTAACYRIALKLVTADLLGPTPRLLAINQAWQIVLTAAAGAVAAKPTDVIRGISNGVYHLATTAGGNASGWIEIMALVGKVTNDPDQLLQAGQVAAWRCGLAHYRRTALAATGTLPPVIRSIIFAGVPGGDLNRRWPRNEKSSPQSISLVGIIGGFTGFGGPFCSPPEVAVIDGALVAADRENTWLVTADRFGATFHRGGGSVTSDSIHGPALLVTIDGKGTITIGDSVERFPDLSNIQSTAATDDTVAVTITTSYHLYLFTVG
jgi:hypothetical protein